MQNALGFLLVNIYALLVIITISILFFNKPRLKAMEDNLYSYFLLTNICMCISGLFLGIIVLPEFVMNEITIICFNKIYLLSLVFWMCILTYYVIYVSLKNKSNIAKINKTFTILGIISTILILILPIHVDISATGGAVASGLAIITTYLICGIGILVQILFVLRNIKNKKFIPVYVLIGLGSVTLTLQVINPSLNYLINPLLIFVAFIMYHTIENPDVKMVNELNSNKRLIEKTNEDKLNLLFELSQEIKQPIKKLEDLSDDIINEKDISVNDIKTIKSYSKQLSLITNNILDVSTMDLNNIKVEKQNYKPDKLFEEMAKRCQEKIADNVDFRYSIESFMPHILYGDSVKIKQIITSILNNAVQNTYEGFIELKVNTIIKYDVCRLIITITDSGVGMSVDKVNDILSCNNLEEKDFEKLDSIDVGIDLAHKMIKVLNGSLIVKSEEGKGSEFLIILDQQIKKEKSLVDTTSNLNDKKRILIVNDKTVELKKMEDILQKMKFDVSTTLYGKDAIMKIKNNEVFDGIILDDEMNLKSGLDTLKELQKIKKFNTPVFITLEDEKKFLKDKYLEDGFKDYVLKDNLKRELERVTKDL